MSFNALLYLTVGGITRIYEAFFKTATMWSPSRPFRRSWKIFLLS
nr:MAG TPA: hypothetical protein [Caudoviricetes sp.]